MDALRKWSVLIIGWTLLVVGASLLLLPGPGIPLVIAGLAILGQRWPRARQWLARLREFLRRGGPDK